MEQKDWKQIKEIFNRAIELKPEERADFLAAACGEDESLRLEVESLLGAYDSEFLEEPAFIDAFTRDLPNAAEETTKILLADESGEPGEPPLSWRGDNLQPNYFRFILIGCLVVLVGGTIVINLFQVFSLKSLKSSGTVNLIDDRVVFTSILPGAADLIQAGDEIVGFNGQPINKDNYRKRLYAPLKAGERYTLRIKRQGEESVREVALTTRPLPFARVLNQYLLGLLLPASFLLTGLGIFLLKPNNKMSVVTAVFFIVGSVVVMSKDGYLELPAVFALWRQLGMNLGIFFLALLLHLTIVFPEPAAILRRFPKFEWLIYIPLLPLFLFAWLTQLALEGWSQFDIVLKMANDPNSLSTPIIFFYPVVCQAFYVFTALIVLLLSYRRTEDEANRRRIRFLVGTFTVALVPVALSIVIGIPIGVLFGFDWLYFLGDWEAIIFWVPMFLMPLAFTYAIVRHKVLPVSLVIRRGLQYLLAKNALRLLLILPIIGVVWNIWAKSERTISEVLLNNSGAFYFCLVAAIVFLLLLRLRLSDWVDRKFFREQYNQERILHELIEAVKQSDSLPKLSRLVSSKIQSALHPSSVYLFFEDDPHSDFSLGYSTNETSQNLKLAAESPILCFMRNKTGAVEFPDRLDDDLPPFEKRWLNEIKAHLLVPVRASDGRLSGIFSVGEKKSEIPYTARDKELLEILAHQIALVHENLNLKDRMHREQRIKTQVLSHFAESNFNLLKECPKCGKCFDRTSEKCPEDGAELTIPLPIERKIENRYRLERLIGKGGMGAVYEARDLRLNRMVAVKILKGVKFGNKDALRRFEREAQTAGKLNHPNIVTIYDYGVLSAEGAFLVMELMHGETLSEILKRQPKLDLKTVKEWFGQVLEGLKAAHSQGIIHRDLKPDNILVTNHGDRVRLCILDFGLARFTEPELIGSVTVPGTVMGTPGYMPLEQLRGERTDERGDLFAIGVIIYECLHGEKPFPGKTYRDVITAMEDGFVIKPGEPMTRFFAQSLAADRKARFDSADRMKKALQNENS